MTPSKVLQRLLTYGPFAIDAVAAVPNRCILATRIACETLAAFGVTAVPMAVDVLVESAGFRRWHEKGRPSPPPPDAWMLGAGTYVAEGTTVRPNAWIGHLVAHVPERELMIDLETHQFHRPAKQMVVGPATIFEWPAGAPGITYETTTPPITTITYVAVPANDAWRTSPDWSRPHRFDDVVGHLVRLIRKGPEPRRGRARRAGRAGADVRP